MLLQKNMSYHICAVQITFLFLFSAVKMTSQILNKIIQRIIGSRHIQLLFAVTDITGLNCLDSGSMNLNLHAWVIQFKKLYLVQNKNIIIHNVFVSQNDVVNFTESKFWQKQEFSVLFYCVQPSYEVHFNYRTR